MLYIYEFSHGSAMKNSRSSNITILGITKKNFKENLEIMKQKREFERIKI